MPLPRIFALLLSCALSLPLWAGDLKEFRLKDGSTLTGQLVEVTEGRFVVQSQSLGRVELDAEQVVSMTSPGAGAGGANPAGAVDLQGLMAQAQQQIYSNPAMLEQVQGLSTDPQINALVTDPAFVGLLMSGDLEAIRQDPRMRQLMENPRLQGLVRQLSGGSVR
jgi:hypothetical protein